MEYTKGEWKASEEEKDFHGNRHYSIRTIHEGRIQRVADTWIEANAQLIASAPDMYGALKSVVFSMSQGAIDKYDLEECKLALRKAGGI